MRSHALRASLASAVGGGPLWLPTEMGAALIAWFDADASGSISESGGIATNWADQSGNGNDASVATSSPAVTADATLGVDVLDTTGEASLKLSTAAGSGLLNTSVHFVARNGPVDGTFTGAAISVCTANNSGPIDFRGGRFHENKSSMGTNYNYATFSDSWYVSSLQVQTSLPNADIYSQIVNGTRNELAFSGNPANLVGKLSLGARDDFAVKFRGYIAEVVYLRSDSEIVDSDQDKVDGYLAHKWGLEGALDAGHPYKSSPPTV